MKENAARGIVGACSTKERDGKSIKGDEGEAVTGAVFRRVRARGLLSPAGLTQPAVLTKLIIPVSMVIMWRIHMRFSAIARSAGHVQRARHAAAGNIK